MRYVLAVVLLLLPTTMSAQDGKVLYFPKPHARVVYKPPMKPVTRFADLKAKHRAEKSWREPIIDDGNSLAFMIQEPAGTKHARQLYADSPVWWAVLEGHIHFEIEKSDRTFQVIEATKGSFVYAPERMLHSFEVVGPEPAIRYEVTVGPAATPVFAERPSTPMPGVDYIPVTLSTGPNPLDVRNQGMADGQPWPYHINVYEMARQHEGKGNFTQEAMRANRSRGNLICGYPSAPRAAGAKPDRGHFHSDTAESWVVMLGELRWTFEGDEQHAIVAHQGDIIYGVPSTFHLPEFTGKDGLNCRLTSSTMPSLNHFYDPR